MARHQGQRPRRTLRVALAALVLAAAAAWVGRRGRPPLRVTGTITLASRLQGRQPGANGVLYIVATNRGGVPVASRRIVNPSFPVFFSLEPDDLLVPASAPLGPLRLEIELNTHGNIGSPVPGDLRGASREPVNPVQQGVHIVVDREV